MVITLLIFVRQVIATTAKKIGQIASREFRYNIFMLDLRVDRWLNW